MKPITTSLCALLATLASTPAAAQNAALERCRDVEGAAQRLACYDAVLPPRVRATAPQGPAAAAPAAPTPAPNALPSVPPREAAAASPVAPGPAAGQRIAPPAAPTAAAAAPPAPAADAEDRFGLEARRRASSDTVDRIRSSIAGTFNGWGPAAKIQLANGQVWQIADDSQAAYDLKNPAVQIERGTLGSFFMRIDGVSHTPRVRRVR